MINTQVAIVGAGPIGLELAVTLKQMGVDYVQFDAGQIGQTISWYPREARFFSSPERIAIAGVPLHTVDQSKATREQYLAYLRSVVEQFDLTVNTYERVMRIDRESAPGGIGFLIETHKGDEPRVYSAQYVVLAVGDMHAPRLLHLPGEDLDHVSHYFEEPHRYFRQRLLIVGGRNSAAEAAIRCYRAGAQVAISYRKSDFDEKAIKYWLLPELKSLVKHGHIRFYPRTMPTRITPSHVTLAPIGDGEDEPFDVAADFVLMLTGYVMDTTLFKMAGVQMLGPNCAPKVDPDTMQSNVPGLFVAGTAVAGTQVRFRLFIENCHVHVARIVHAITGSPPPENLINPVDRDFSLPES